VTEAAAQFCKMSGSVFITAATVQRRGDVAKGVLKTDRDSDSQNGEQATEIEPRGPDFSEGRD